MGKTFFLWSCNLLLIFSIHAQWNPNGDNSTTGNITSLNPQNPSASSMLSWRNNIARIRVGGIGNGASNGFDLQGPGDTSLLRVDGNGRVGVGITNPAQEIDVNGEVQSKGFVLVDETYGSNSDYTALFREDIGIDNATVKLRIGDDVLGNFQFGYKSWQTGEWISTFYINNFGKVGIGTTAPDAKLTVKGDIHAEEVKVDLNVPAPDYVFKKGYDLKSLEDVQNYIQKHEHLPNIPSAKEMEDNGIDLGVMNMKLLEKIEELTLYTLEQEEKIMDYKKLLLKEKEVNICQEARIAKLEKFLTKK